MDVKCERCSTEYEFDDALVSGRGTTVKCTNCGHKFKIRRGDGDYSEDFWNVTTGDGRTLVFTSLRELQRAIQGYLVERNDRLSRGGLPPKAIGHIPELAPFFDQREAAKRGLREGKAKTQDGLGPAGALSSPAPATRSRQATTPEFPAPPPEGSASSAGKTTLMGTGPTSAEEAFSSGPVPTPPIDTPALIVGPPPVAEKPPAPRVSTRPMETPAPAASSAKPAPGRSAASRLHATLPSTASPVRLGETPPDGTRTVSAPPPAAARSAEPRRASVPPPVPARNPAPASTPRLVVATPTGALPPVAASTPPPVPARPATSTPPVRPAVSAPPPVPPRPPPPPVERPSEPEIAQQVSSPLPPRPQRSLVADLEGRNDDDDDFSVPRPRGRSYGGAIVAVALIGCAVVAVLWMRKDPRLGFDAKPVASAPAVDPRVASFLASGEKALGEGNLEFAKESFDKASALSEKDPHVLLGLARLAAVRADVFWLKSRLLPPDAADEQRFTRESLSEQVATARRTADDAVAASSDDPAAVRAKLDALRIAGDRDAARALASKLAAVSAQPESAYVLAALDLSEAEPLWPTVIERLKAASSAEVGPGRARAALVYALARSGDAAGAKSELDRLGGFAKAHPLLPLLRAFVERTKSAKSLDAGVDASIAPVGANAEVVEPGKRGKEVKVAAGGNGGGISGDARDLVVQGERARARGEYEKARSLFGAAVDKNPNDSEALSGLAAIAHAQHDLAGARTAYKRVLAINPNYMPALVGLADVDWESGDKASATKAYKDIVDRFPEGSYPSRVRNRVEGGT